MASGGDPAWRVHLLTANVTRLRLHAPASPPGSPWMASRALRGLAACGATPLDRPDVLGAGRGHPLLTRHRLGWRGVELHLECLRAPDGTEEIRLEMPPWDELVAQPEIHEDAVWDLAGALVQATGAQRGDIGDGDGGGSVAGVLVADPGSRPVYRALPGTALAVVLR